MDPTRFGASLTALAGVALGCASSTGPVPGSLQAQLEREVEPPDVTEIATADGSVRARIAGKLIGEFAQAPDGSYYGMFDIGTQTPASCQLFNEKTDPAALLARMSDRLFTQIGAQRTIGKKAVYEIGAGNAGAYPYLGLDWIATLDDAGFHLKQRFGNRGDRSLYCVHDDPGYSKTFDAFFAGFLGALELPEEQGPPQFREISLLRIGGQEVGFEVSSVRREEEGAYRSDTQVALLVPSAADQVHASDDYSIEISRPDGSVINEVSISSNGVDLTRLSLEREESAWTVRGEMQGKSISESFDTPEQLTSAIQELRHIQNVARGEATELRYWRWLGASSPEKPIEHVMRRSGDSSVTIDAGPVRLEIEVDELGPKLGTMKLGRLEVEMERVYIDGSF